MATPKSVLIAVRVSQEIASALDRLGQGAKIHTPLGRWKRGEAPLRPKLREKLSKYLDAL